MTVMRAALPLLLALTAFALADGRVGAQEARAPEASTDQVLIEYLPVKDEALQPIRQRLMRNSVLERFQRFLSPLRLPRTLFLRLQDCDGESNAWYENHAITVCYEYIAELIKHAPKRPTPAGVSAEDAIVGPTIEVFLHEAGHAVFSMLNIPVLGREEDAADQFAAYVLLTLGKQDARRFVGGIAFMYQRDVRDEQRQVKGRSAGMQAFAAEHGFAGQRLYNLLCIAYGAYPEVFQDIVDSGHLPKARARRCAQEYKRLKFAMQTLVRPHLDLALLEEVQRQRWLDPATAAAQ